MMHTPSASDKPEPTPLRSAPTLSSPLDGVSQTHAIASSRPWYESSTGNHQGLIVDEQTGRNVAVTYDKADAAHIVKCVNAHDSLVQALEWMLDNFEYSVPRHVTDALTRAEEA